VEPTLTASFLEERRELVRRPGPIGSGRRTALTVLTDDWLRALFRDAEGSGSDVCLLAVGGHGRMEMAPGSDLDLVVLHRTDPRRASRTAERMWYPIWDSGLRLDHSLRSVGEARRLASVDMKVLLGMLDARVVAGDGTVAEQLKESIFADWRSMAPRRVPDLRALVDVRRERFGELATLLEPDLKEAYGGLREATVLRAIAASWITDIAHAGWEEAVDFLLDIRWALHSTTGRAGDVLRLQEQEQVASELGLADADALLRRAYESARSIAYASDSAWHRVTRLTSKAPRFSLRQVRRPGSDRVPLAEGVVVQAGEIVLATEARPDRDPTLALRAAAAAAQSGLPLAPITVQRLAAESAPLPRPWPRSARESFVSLIGAGTATVGVWEAMDQAGIIASLLPGWDVVRSAPQRNAVHRFTVDRHLVETAVQASALTRSVDRPDLLLVAALLHDIGKARGGDHSVVGAELSADLAPMMGFDEEETGIIVTLVRHHLLLVETATRRDLDDPATAAFVAERIGSVECLELLTTLTRADALATGPAAWSEWRSRLVDDLVRRCLAVLAGRPAPQAPTLTDGQLSALEQDGIVVHMEAHEDHYNVTVAAPDRVGLLAAVAGLLSLHRLQVRSARVVTVGDRAAQIWTVQPMFGDPPGVGQFSEDLRRALDGAMDVPARLRERDDAYARTPSVARPAPRVDVLTHAADRSTVLEVRAHDESGLLYRIASAVSSAGAGIAGAKVATLGSEAVDVFFLVDGGGLPLSEDHATAVQVTVMKALEQQVP
jgi:[protein-PII] uridylyltransferase